MCEIDDSIIIRVIKNKQNEWCLVDEDCDVLDIENRDEQRKPPPAENTTSSKKTHRIDWSVLEYFPILVHAIEIGVYLLLFVVKMVTNQELLFLQYMCM